MSRYLSLRLQLLAATLTLSLPQHIWCRLTEAWWGSDHATTIFDSPNAWDQAGAMFGAAELHHVQVWREDVRQRIHLRGSIERAMVSNCFLSWDWTGDWTCEMAKSELVHTLDLGAHFSFRRSSTELV